MEALSISSPDEQGPSSNSPISTSQGMSVEEKFRIVRSVGEECIQEDDLLNLLSKKLNPVCYDGFEPSGRMHIAQAVTRLMNFDFNEGDCETIDKKIHRFNLGVSAVTGSIDNHLTVLQLLYTCDISNAINSVSTALNVLPVALELLFEDCVRSCVRFLEAVPWTEEEERRVVSLIPFLSEEESKELLSRVSPVKDELSEEMLYGLILTRPASIEPGSIRIGQPSSRSPCVRRND